ncbi:MAG: hypothetical protein ACKO3N_02430, partial [Verrucomicrobiota bacterium]
RPRGTFLLETQPLRLRPGQYTISLWLNDSTENLEHLPHVIAFEVSRARFNGFPQRSEVVGPLEIEATWTAQ